MRASTAIADQYLRTLGLLSRTTSRLHLNCRVSGCGVTVEHEAPVALGDKLEILVHAHPAGSTNLFGQVLIDRAVTTLTYVVGDQTAAIAAILAP
jgi:acyl-ACP thioesterase